MFLTIDVGNSNIHLGMFDDSCHCVLPRFLDSFTFSYNQNLLRQILSFVNKHKVIKGIILSDAYGSNSLMNNSKFNQIVKNLSDFILLTPSVNSGLRIKYYTKSSLGTDRIANCVAACTIYKKDCLVIDFGTATTFNAVSKQGEFLGGLITPGIKSIYETLPNHLIENPKSVLNQVQCKSQKFIPKALALSTKDAVQSGIYYFTIGAVEKIICEIENQINKKLYTIATGNGMNITPNLKSIFDVFDSNLTLKGLAIIYQRIIQGDKND